MENIFTDRLLNDYPSDSVEKYAKTELGRDQNPKATLALLR